MKTMFKNVKKIALMFALVLGISVFANAQTKTAVKVADLQKSITDNIAKDYAGYTIKDAYKVDKNKVITYNVNIVKDDKTVRLSYDNNGKFLKAVEPKNKTSKTGKTTKPTNTTPTTTTKTSTTPTTPTTTKSSTTTKK